MEVTNLNFKEVFPQIEEAIKNATFLAIDCEFSGLNSVSEVVNAFDTTQDYYEKICKNSEDFLLIQYGLSAFRFDSSDKVFKQQTYNFYIFRRPIDRNIPDQRFLCQTSSIDFLMSQGFDFNKLFKHGIPYLNDVEETKYREALEEKQQKNVQPQIQKNKSDIVPIPDENKAVVDDILQQIDDFFESGEDEVELSKCNNPFIRKLIYQSVDQRYEKKEILLKTEKVKNSNDRILKVRRGKSQKEEAEIAKQTFEEKLSELEDFVGFSKVLKCIIAENKVVVGHNLCLDLLHTIRKFLTPLPDDYEQFKELTVDLFSGIIDTKFMASSEEFKTENLQISSTILKDLLETCSKEPLHTPIVEIEEGGQGYSTCNPKEHEAGYDAYITGLCFISMWKYLGETSDLSAEDTFSNFNLIKPFMNRLYVFLRDMHINLTGTDPVPSRDHVFYIEFPKEWKLNDLIDLFSPYGNIQVSWINDVSAYISLNRKEQAASAFKALCKKSSIKVQSYKQRQMSLRSGEQPLNRKRTSSDNILISNNKKMRTEQNTVFLPSISGIAEDTEAAVKAPSSFNKELSRPSRKGSSTSKKKRSTLFVECDEWPTH